MKQEKSCGAVVFTREGSQILYLLIRNKNGSWGFPKGHMEAGEQEMQTAAREIWEETGLRVRFLEGFRQEDQYEIPKRRISKQVVYFLGVYEKQQYAFQTSEISCGGLYAYAEAQKLLQFAGAKQILAEADKFLRAK